MEEAKIMDPRHDFGDNQLGFAKILWITGEYGW